MPTEFPNLETARRYLKAIEDGLDHDEFVKFFDPEVVQEEFPNRLTASGAKRDLKALLDGNHFAVFLDFRDRKIIAQRNYDCFDPW